MQCTLSVLTRGSKRSLFLRTRRCFHYMWVDLQHQFSLNPQPCTPLPRVAKSPTSHHLQITCWGEEKRQAVPLKLIKFPLLSSMYLCTEAVLWTFNVAVRTCCTICATNLFSYVRGQTKSKSVCATNKTFFCVCMHCAKLRLFSQFSLRKQFESTP